MQDSFPAQWSDPDVILVATDLGDLDRLMPHALAQAATSHAHLLLLHVISADVAVQLDAGGTPIYDAGEAIQATKLALKPWCEAAAAQHIACAAMVREGEPAEQIALAARQFGADRILIGTRSPSKKRKLELGSVAEQVLRSVNIPVITVGPEAHLQDVADDRPPVVLHATTLRETSRPSAALACRIAAHHGANLVLLHVAPHVEEMRRRGERVGIDSEAMQQLDRLRQETSGCGCLQIEPRVVHGNRLIEILATAAECQASLIVLGIAGERAFDSLTRDHAILQVLAHARCPVMTLRSPCAVTAEVPEPAAAAGRG
jgi:nucleotide-binding universal stress UspA family protein